MKILVIDIDTLRPDHLSCYGYPRKTSPNIDKIASEGVLFENYYCSDAPCLPSRAALMTGRFGLHTGIVGHGGTAADMRLDRRERKMQDHNGRDNLPAVLRKYGMYTVLFSSFGERHGAHWINAGFNEMYNFGKYGNESAEDITPTVLKWLGDNTQKDNWYLHVNYWDPHTPYRAPADFGNPFENEPLPQAEWMNEALLKEHRSMAGPHTARDLSMYDDDVNPRTPRQLGKIENMDDFKANMDGYDCGIAYADLHVGKIVEMLKEQGIYEETAIIVTADHGENMGELGVYDEHATADNTTCHIPMIIKWPGGVQGHRDGAFHYNLDLIATLKELLGEMPPLPIPAKIVGSFPATRYDSQSYARTVMKGEEEGREYLVISQNAHVCQRAVRFDYWIFIKTYHDGYHLFDEEMLFNVKDDPAELHNVASENRELCHKAVYLLEKWHAENMKKMNDISFVDPMWVVMNEGGPFHANGKLEEYCRRLEETDRGHTVPELKRRHPGEFSPK